ncbi:hypothetical protein U9M48_038439 [Paspalum notatum var. saurae]|uniref:Secreted protein n=1 Tax=Paspalum notatum var. saurae TaxID=547442 RepID=A0AAQ3XB26_PASNO
MLLLISTTCFVQLPVPAHARKLEARAPAIASSPRRNPCTGRSVLQVPAAKETTESTSPGHSPSTGHGGGPPSF